LTKTARHFYVFKNTSLGIPEELGMMNDDRPIMRISLTLNKTN